MTPKKCSVCGEILGTNQNCKECLKEQKRMMQQMNKEINDIKPEDVEPTIKKGEKFLQEKGRRLPNDLFAKFEILLSLLTDYWKGKYREVPWTVIAAIIFAIAYVINPIDLIPDFIPVLGFVDDALVVSLVFLSINHELKKYCVWKNIELV